MRRTALAVLISLGACSSSGASSPPNPEAAKCIAHRTTKQLECVDLFTTKLEIDACRDKVKAEIQCVDAGAEGGAK